MKITPGEALITTLAYADVFDYPMTGEELKRWLLFFSRVPVPDKGVERDGKFYLLSGRKRIVRVRIERGREVPVKLAIAGRMAGLLKFVPTVKLVGVTGGLAMGNAKVADDIDFFIIAGRGTLWITRLISTILIELTGRRRHPGEKEVGNSICLNMFMSEENLGLPAADRDLFSAHEVLQMLPLWEKDNLYLKFLKANSWVKYFLPNAWSEKVKSQTSKVKSYQKFPINVFDFLSGISLIACYLSLKLTEPLSKWMQLRYMKNHRTTEVVSDTVIRFHPRDARIWVKKILEKRLRPFNIPLDKIFYSS